MNEWNCKQRFELTYRFGYFGMWNWIISNSASKNIQTCKSIVYSAIETLRWDQILVIHVFDSPEFESKWIWIHTKNCGVILNLFLVNYAPTKTLGPGLWVNIITPFAVKINLSMVIFWPRFQSWCIVTMHFLECMVWNL